MSKRTSRPARLVLAALLAATFAGGALLVSGCSNDPMQTTADQPSATASSDQGQQAASGSADESADGSSSDEAGLAVEVTVDSSAADGSASFSGTVELPEGANAYDALVATGLDVKASESQYGMYIESVEGLAGGDFGEMSGWTYEVNGEVAMVAADAYDLSDGDVVSWTYTTGE